LKDSISQLLTDISDFLSAMLKSIQDAFETLTEPFRGFKESIKKFFGISGEQQPQQPQQPQEQQPQKRWWERLNPFSGKAPANNNNITINLGVDVTAALASTEEIEIREFGRKIAEITADEIDRAMRRAYGVT
jgi:hypothetical protein